MDKVLLVEDEVNIASFIKRGLEEFGYDVTVAYDGESGWNEIQNGVFNLLIFDIIMPKISGLELYQRYREQFGYATPRCCFSPPWALRRTLSTGSTREPTTMW